MSHRGAAHRAIASRKVQPATGLRYPTGWAVVNQPPGKHDRCPIPYLPTREIDGGPTPGALRSDDTHAPSGVAYDPMSPGSAFMLPHPFADERLSPSARERVRIKKSAWAAPGSSSSPPHSASCSAPGARRGDSGAITPNGGSRREAAIRRNRTCQKCSAPHGRRQHRLVEFGVADEKASEQLILMFEEHSNRLVHGLSEWSRQFPGWGKPALLGHDHPGKHRLKASSAQEPPGSKLKAEIP